MQVSLTDRRDLILDEGAGCPARLTATDAEEEIRDDLAAASRVCHFWMELHAEERPVLRPESRDWHGLGGSQHLEAGRYRLHAVAVAHPHRRALTCLETIEQIVGLQNRELGTTVLPLRGAVHGTAAQLSDQVHPVADAQDRDTQVKQRGIRAGDVVPIDARRPSREHHTGRLRVPDPVDRAARRVDLAVDALLSDTPRDELRVL
jgi:hypothetical protein